jgi:anti-sigma factor RsiW
MDCKRVDEILDQFTAGELSPEEADGVREHMAACARCRASEGQYARALEALRLSGETRVAPDNAFYRGLARRLDEIDGYAGRNRVQPVRWYFVGSVAAAAAAVFIFAVYVAPSLNQGDPRDGQGGTVVASTDKPVATIETTRGTQPFSTVPVSTSALSSYNRSPERIWGHANVGPRIEFPSYPRPVSPSPQAVNYVTLDEYRRIEQRLKIVEAKLASMEQGGGSPR